MVNCLLSIVACMEVWNHASVYSCAHKSLHFMPQQKMFLILFQLTDSSPDNCRLAASRAGNKCTLDEMSRNDIIFLSLLPADDDYDAHSIDQRVFKRARAIRGNKN